MKNTTPIRFAFLFLSVLASLSHGSTESDRGWGHATCRKQLSLPVWASFLGLTENTLGKKVRELRGQGITRIPLIPKHQPTNWWQATSVETQRRTKSLQKMLPDCYLPDTYQGTGRAKLTVESLFSLFLLGDAPNANDPTPAWLGLGAAVAELLEMTFEPRFTVSELGVRLERETSPISAIHGFHLDGADVTATVSFGAPGTEFLAPIPRLKTGRNAGAIDWVAVKASDPTEQIREGTLVIFTNNDSFGTPPWIHRPPKFQGVRRRLWLARYSGRSVAAETAGPSSRGMVSPATQVENRSR